MSQLWLRFVFQEPLANPENHEVIMDFNDLETDLQEVVLVDRDQFITVNVLKVKEYERIAEDCKMFEQKTKEYERIIKEMQQKEKQNDLVSENL